MASETGVLPMKPEEVEYKGRLQPGKMLLVTLAGSAALFPTKRSRSMLATRQPYGEVAEGESDHAGRAAGAAARVRLRSADAF